MSLATTLAQVALGLLLVGSVLAFVRIVRGPHLGDRVAAFDLLSIQVLGVICSSTIITNNPIILDAAIILALLAFLATVAFARYIEKQAGGVAHA